MFTTDDSFPLPDPTKPDQPADRYAPLEPTVNWTKDGKVFDNAEVRQPIDLSELPLAPRVFDWDTRTVVFPHFAAACNTMLTKKMTFDVDDGHGGKVSKEFFDDVTPTSAVTGTMLTSFISKMKIMVPEAAASDQQEPPDNIATPRQIRMPGDASDDPTTWQPVPHDPPAPQPAPGPSPPSESSLSRPAPASRPIGMPNFFDKNLFPTIPDAEKTNIPTSNPAKTLGTPRPQFACKVFPLGQQPPQGKDVAQVLMYPPGSKQDIPIDLVVALTPVSGAGLSQDTLHNLQLFSVTVEIPVGVTANHFTLKYTGPGGKMLSNPRFNVHVSPMRDRVQFTLVPRATGRLVPLRNIPDLSFAIWQIRANGVIDKNLKRGEVSINVQENYRRMDSGKYFSNQAVNRAILSKVMAAT